MNDFTDCGTVGSDTGLSDGPTCGHDCHLCLDTFEATQGELERLRIDLAHISREHTALFSEMRIALLRTLSDLAPMRRTARSGVATEEFARGWNQCVAEIERRIRELQKII